VHALLRHFEAVGFDGAPRVLGHDDEEGREILSFVSGEAAVAPVPASDEVPRLVGALLRRMHDAQEGFVGAPDLTWQSAPNAPATGEVVCHNDLFWPNVVFRDGAPVALIDWDLAAPGERLHDLADAANYWAPLRDDRTATAWGLPMDRRGQRLRALCDGYGLDDRSALLEAIDHVNRRGFALYHQWGRDERRPGWAELWDRDQDRYLLAKQEWLDAHRQEVEEWLA
jgi:thiamine kinase-like enzyme